MDDLVQGDIIKTGTELFVVAYIDIETQNIRLRRLNCSNILSWLTSKTSFTMILEYKQLKDITGGG